MSKLAVLQNTEINELKKILAEKQLSYVLITCTSPTNEGKMDIELDYQGDQDLLSYLIDSAKNIIE